MAEPAYVRSPPWTGELKKQEKESHASRNKPGTGMRKGLVPGFQLLKRASSWTCREPVQERWMKPESALFGVQTYQKKRLTRDL